MISFYIRSMTLNTSNASPVVCTRILNFLNHAPNADSIAGIEQSYGPVIDDPTTGYGDNIADYDIGALVAGRILNKRDSLPGGTFTNISQLDGIDHFGQDKFNDLVHTFSRYWELFFNVSLYAQITWYYCGAASAQMILDFVNGWNGVPQINQDDIYDIIQTYKQDNSFYTDPAGLRGCLDQESPNTIGWIVHGGKDQEVSNRKIAVNMDLYQAPASALVYNGNHWIVVSGITATERPSMVNKSYVAYTFRIHDPGNGGDIRDVDYYTWCSSYHTPNVWGTTWKDQYVSVLDPRVKADKRIKFYMPSYKSDGKKLLTPEEAKKFATECLDDYFLSTRDDYKEALKGASPGSPVLVENLQESKKPHYYLVPFEKGDKTTVVVRLHAYFGNFLEAKITNQPLGYLRVKEIRAKELVSKKLNIDKGSVKKATLVWKPSEQSWDPFKPIWKVQAGSRVRYVSQSREISSKLSLPQKGGL